MAKLKNSKIIYPGLKDFTKFLSEFHMMYYKNLPCNIKGRDLYNKWEKDSTCDIFGTQLEFVEVGNMRYNPTDSAKSNRYLAIDILHRQNGLCKGNFRFISYFLAKSKLLDCRCSSDYSKMTLGELQVANHFLAAVYNIIDDHFKHSKRWKRLPIGLKWKKILISDDTKSFYEIGLHSPYSSMNIGLVDDKLICYFGGWGNSIWATKPSHKNSSHGMIHHTIELSNPNSTNDLGQTISDLYWDDIKFRHRL